ncbi:MAG: PA0069 family radical SAM protein [Kofleriaceae bacterium]|nr:PA0069 family radical SAM protein [Kofleriaceae bacterium]
MSSGDGARRGRGALSNPTGRFEPTRREGFADGWAQADPALADDGELPRLPTVVTTEHARSIISRNDSPDVPFDQSANPYRGCEHGCVYCFARPSHGYLGLSSGLDFETHIVSKPDAARLLRAELSRPTYRCQVLAMGTNTDPYQPVERDLGLTRAILEVCLEFAQPVSIVTKSAAITRDVDLLAALAARNLASVYLSITTLDAGLAATLEPRAARPHRRLATLRQLADAGVPVGVLSSPMIPALNDHELEAILEAARDHGARAAGYTLLRLPHDVKVLFTEWLHAHVPDRAERVLARLREAYGGALYDSAVGVRGVGRGPVADLINQRFALACRRLGLGDERVALDTTQFRPPPRPGQLPLFR